MAKIYAIVGASGSGKTLLLSNFAERSWFKGERLFSNYDLDFNTPRTPLADRIRGENLNYTPIFTPSDFEKITNGSAIFLTEIDSFGGDVQGTRGVDSYDFRSESATQTEKFFKKRLRKMHCSVYYDVQQLKMVPKRIRDETLFVYEPYIHKWGVIDERVLNPKAKPNMIQVPYVVHYRVRKLNNITGEHDLTNEIKKLIHPIWGYQMHPTYGYIRHVTPDMLTIYDTDSDPFKNADYFNSLRGIDSESGKTVFKNELKIMKRFKTRLPEATVSLIPDSGINCKKYGDIEIEFPKSYDLPKFIVEVKGIGKVVEGEIRSINCKTKEGNVTNWAGGIAYDENFGTKHLCAYLDTYKKNVYLFGVAENFNYMGKKTYPYLRQIEGIIDIAKFGRMCKKKRMDAEEISVSELHRKEDSGEFELNEQ